MINTCSNAIAKDHLQFPNAVSTIGCCRLSRINSCASKCRILKSLTINKQYYILIMRHKIFWSGVCPIKDLPFPLSVILIEYHLIQIHLPHPYFIWGVQDLNEPGTSSTTQTDHKTLGISFSLPPQHWEICDYWYSLVPCECKWFSGQRCFQLSYFPIPLIYI